MAVASDFVSVAQDCFAPLWVELSLILFFCVGFSLLRPEFIRRFSTVGSKRHAQSRRGISAFKRVEAEFTAGNSRATLAAWRAVEKTAPASADTLRHVATAFLEVAPTAFVDEVVGHLETHRDALGNAATAAALLDTVARAGNPELLAELFAVLQQRVRVRPSAAMHEALLGGYASAGDASKVHEVQVASRALRHPTARGFAVTIKGFLKNGLADEALAQIREMQAAGYAAPEFALAQLFRVAATAGRAEEIWHLALAEGLPVSSDAAMVLLMDCMRRGDAAFAHRVHDRLRGSGAPAPPGALGILVKLCASSGDVRGLALLQELNEVMPLSEAFSVSLLGRCAESKFQRLAEEVVAIARSQGTLSLTVYSALMKVYAFSRMFDKACDLYDAIRTDGLEPDATMYGCLMRFAAECGRTRLADEIFGKVACADLQSYMSLIRGAAHDKDVPRAFAILESVKKAGLPLDIAVYNSVLDVCVIVGDMARAQALVDEMATLFALDMITYNTLLKGYCSQGKLQEARGLLRRMEAQGVAPNDISYNCLINAAACAGNLGAAWEAVETMEQRGLHADGYTIATLMKLVKRCPRGSPDVSRVLRLLDASKLVPFQDEVLLNLLLDMCTRHEEHQRLLKLLDGYQASGMRPSPITYGILIKASSALQQVERCRKLWAEMVEHRALTPTDLGLGCMLDALIRNGAPEEANDLFEAWRPKIPANAIICSTMIKGFASMRRPDLAMGLLREMRAEGVQLNLVLYNGLIDAQAREGNMEVILELLAEMEKAGIAPDHITRSTVAKGFCMKGDLEKAMDVFRKAPTDETNIVLFNTVLDACARRGNFALGDELLARIGRGVVPTSYTLGLLARFWGRRRQLERAFTAFEELPQRFRIRVDSPAWCSLITACLGAQDVPRACEAFTQMQAAPCGPDRKAFDTLLAGCIQGGYLERACILVETLCQQNKAALVDTARAEQLLRSLPDHNLASLGVPLVEALHGAGVPVNARLRTTVLSKAVAGPVPGATSMPPWRTGAVRGRR